MNLKHIFYLVSFLFISMVGYSQDDFENWNKRYTEINITDLIHYEKTYADSVDNGLIEGKYYSRMGFYRLEASFQGEKRKTADSIIVSMKNVNKLFGNKKFDLLLDKAITEYLFKIDGTNYWLPIQDVLKESFENEIAKSDIVMLYCVLFNEHRFNGALYNTFLISEFQKEPINN
jgi:hypothetical protein